MRAFYIKREEKIGKFHIYCRVPELWFLNFFQPKKFSAVVPEKFILVFYMVIYIGLFISPSGISELDCATTKTDTAERSISIGR